MTTPNSNDFFKDMGAGSPAPPPARPKTTLARPPAPMIGGTGTTPTTSSQIGGVTGTTQISKPPPAGMRPIGATPTGGRTSAAARGTPTAGRGRTGTAGRSATGRTSAGRRPTTARGPRPASTTTPAPVGGTGFYNPSSTSTVGTPSSTHLSSSITANKNPYVAGGTSTPSSDAWFSSPEPKQDQAQPTPSAMNPYATPSNNTNLTNSNNNFSQWQQPNNSQWQQPQPNANNQWQNPQQQQNQQLQALATMGGSFLMNSMMGSSSGMTNTSDPSAFPNPYCTDEEDFENEPPLLEELGINIEHIRAKTLAVILPFQRVTGNVIHMEPSVIVEDADLAGPLMFALALGGELLMTGKLHFGYIYGFGLFGCMAVTLLLNLMSPQDPISVWTVASILGYGLLPVNILAAVKIVVVNIIRLETFGRILALLAIIWSTVASTRLLEVGCGLRHQRYLIGYPIALLYSAFVLMTIF